MHNKKAEDANLRLFIGMKAMKFWYVERFALLAGA